MENKVDGQISHHSSHQLAFHQLDQEFERYLLAGCDLWIVPQVSVSAWARHIDWYLNSQIMKTELHSQIPFPQELAKIEEEWGVDREGPVLDSAAPTMIASSRHLPNRQTVLVPYDGNLETWSKSCYQLWQNLQSPTVRLFLPDGVSVEELSKKWKPHDSFSQLQVVPPL
jgi:hypothetical protein